MQTNNRIVFLDWLRVIACFLVIMTHCNEPIYLGGLGTSVASATDAFWSTFFVSLCRCCVPLFVLASSYLLFPVKGDTLTFFKKRTVRVIIPAALWLVLYCFMGRSDVAGNFRMLPFNFPGTAGHLWFCYMIVGLYMIMPLLSPWAEKVGKKELLTVLGIWLFTTIIPALRQFNLDLNGSWSIWGEGNWTEFGTFYYFSGFIGYLLLGLYFRKYVGEMSWTKTLLVSVPLFVLGFAISAAWFYGFMPKTYPFDEPISTAVHMEVMLRFCSISVVMMTVAAFLVIRKIKSGGWFYRHLVLPVSKASYGMYLMHIFALVPIFGFWRGVFGTEGFWATPAAVVVSAVCTYVVCAVVSIVIGRIPKLGKFVVGAVVVSACTAEVNPVLDIEGGLIQGVETSIENVYVYKGVPFAAPPVGELRWQKPQPVIPWDGVRVADTFGPGAYQLKHDSTNPWTSEFYWEDPEFSEDCLYLNVYTKAPGRPDAKLPVAMWIHGGAYTGGWGYEPEFDGKVWADKGVVLVTINYRLGVFGFLSYPGVSGNFGILDQIAALEWIHNNIAAFGGDPDNITIFGQSAGAGSVKTLVSSPLTGDLIKKAVIQSGGGVGVPGSSVRRSVTKREMELLTKEYFDGKGYESLEQMRAAPTEQMFADAADFRFFPIIDDYVSEESFDDAAYGGRIKDIPYMIGYTSDDLGNPGEGVERFCDLRAEAGKPVFEYEFAHSLPDDEAGSHDMKGAFHSSELWYVFKSLDRGDRPFVQADWDLAETMVSCWTDFAKYGNPGHGWEPYARDDAFKMVFDVCPTD